MAIVDQTTFEVFAGDMAVTTAELKDSWAFVAAMGRV